MSLKRWVWGAFASAFLVSSAGAAMAQAAANWPNKPVRMIVNFAPGGSADNSMRPFAERLSRVLGQTFVIENKGGASGSIGIEAMIKSPADGYTFLVTPTLSVAILPHMRPVAFDVFKDLVPVSQITAGTLLLAVHPTVAANTVPDLVSYIKQNPGKLSWGTAGVGSQGHMICEVFKLAAGLDILHVPYRGGGELLADFLSGVVQLHADPNTLPHVSAGKVKLLAVVDDTRHPSFPDVPKLSEFYPEIDFTAWFAVFAPAGTPADIVRKFSLELNKIAREPDLAGNLLKIALRPTPGTPEELAAILRKDFDRYGKIIREQDLAAK